MPRRRNRISFKAVNERAHSSLLFLLYRWLPQGRLEGREYVALNPTRVDNKLGSFRINIETGKWSDFSTGDRGGDVISYTAYIFRLSQYEAAINLSRMLGISHD